MSHDRGCFKCGDDPPYRSCKRSDCPKAYDEPWRSMDRAPRDGTVFLVYARGAHGLPPMVSLCSYDKSAGFCIDELREPLCWVPLPSDFPQNATRRKLK